jgi:tRNA (guanine-N7-)-methyltransferase
LLVTTRDQKVLKRLQADDHCVALLSHEQVMELLARWAGTTTNDLPLLTATDVVRECGYLLLAIATMGAQANCPGEQRRDRLQLMLTRLREKQLDRFEQHFPEYQYPHLLRAIEVSVEALGAEKIPDLASVTWTWRGSRKDAAIPAAVLRTFWQTLGPCPAETDEAVDRLRQLSLVRQGETGLLTLHDVQRRRTRGATEQAWNASRQTRFRRSLVTPRRLFVGFKFARIFDSGQCHEPLNPDAPTQFPAKIEVAAAGAAATNLIYDLPSIVERLDLVALFPTKQPLEVELGSGDATFLANYAALHPDHNFIGVERLLGRMRKLDRKGRRAGLQNLRGVRIESSYFLQYLLPPHSAAALHVYFPDPWPKKKHRRRRLINDLFPALAREALSPGGVVYLRTDDEDYFQQMVSVFAVDSRFRPIETPPELAALPTDFEKDFQARGVKILRAAYQRD